MTHPATFPPAEMSSEEFEGYLELSPTLRPELSFEAYLKLPECRRRLEVIDGVIVMSPTGNAWHQRFGLGLASVIGRFTEPPGLGKVFVAPLDVLIRKWPKLRTRQPDLFYLGAEKLAGLDLEKVHIFEVAPDLVVEVRSGGKRPREWAEKLTDYAEIGVREVWRVHQKSRSIEVLELHSGQYVMVGTYGRDEVLTPLVIPGLEIPLGILFDAI